MLNHTILAFKSGFLISLISRFTFSQSFETNKATNLSLFSPVFQSINADFAV
ncbi:MAG: hypothetical protein Q8S84_03885 [bacterium]|nr:hypothetical protein [bacterium]MDP3380657.1 hypothetical protein [bacterium]